MKILEIKEYKGIDNAWLDPDGNLYKCHYMGHNEWAMNYFKEKNNDDYIKARDEIDSLAGYSGLATDALHELNWFRILTWTSSKGTILIPDYNFKKLTHEQKDTIMFWESLNNKKLS